MSQVNVVLFLYLFRLVYVFTKVADVTVELEGLSYGLDETGFKSRQGQQIFLFSK